MSETMTASTAASEQSDILDDAEEGGARKGGAARPAKLNPKNILRRVERIRAMADKPKARKAQNRLMKRVLRQIADGDAASPQKIAAAVLQGSDDV